MLRLKSIDYVGEVDVLRLGQPEGHVGVRFYGPVGKHSFVEVTVYIEDQDRDAAVLAAAEQSLRAVVAALHQELSTDHGATDASQT